MTNRSVTVLQKALLPWQSEDALKTGTSGVGGIVTLAGEANRMRSAAEIAGAYRWGEERTGPGPSFVDVVRFPLDPLMELSRPRDVGAVPWPTYANGFLRSEHLVRAFALARTRYPQRSECWRVHADGRQELVDVYRGAARGWAGAAAYTPPVRMVGPRARWEGVEYAADLLDTETVELVAVGPEAPPGFEPARPMTWVRRVAMQECESVFTVVLEATWHGVRGRVVDRVGDQARLLLAEPTPDEVRIAAAREVEPGFFETTVLVDELTDVEGVANELRHQRTAS